MNRGKGYQKVKLLSPCKRYEKSFIIPGERVPDDKLTPGSPQWLLKRYLSKGWRPKPRSQSSAGDSAQKASAARKAMNKLMQKAKIAQRAQSHNSGRDGDAAENEIINIDGTRYSKFISTLATMQNMGGGKRLAQIGIGIDVPEFARHMIGELDFEPWLYRPVMVPAKRFLLSVDSSGSCMDLIPITRAIAKLLSHYRELSVESYENFNGKVYDPDVYTKIDNGYYDFIIYLGDDDVLGSHFQKCETKTIAFVKEHCIPYMARYTGFKNRFYAHGVDFEFGDDMAEGLLKAREHFESIG